MLKIVIQINQRNLIFQNHHLLNKKNQINQALNNLRNNKSQEDKEERQKQVVIVKRKNKIKVLQDQLRIYNKKPWIQLNKLLNK